MANGFSYREIDKTKRGVAKPGSSGKIKKQSNFKLALSMGVNWADLDTGIMYHIQEYADAMRDPKIPQEKKPTKIKMSRIKDGKDLGWAEPELVAIKMKDPEPDPNY